MREEGVFPPSVMDCHYGDKVELTKAEIVLKSLEEMGLLPLSETDPRFAEKMRFIPVVVAQLQRRLPSSEITTCGALRALGMGCCNACHTEPPHGMKLVELPLAHEDRFEEQPTPSTKLGALPPSFDFPAPSAKRGGIMGHGSRCDSQADLRRVSPTSRRRQAV